MSAVSDVGAALRASLAGDLVKRVVEAPGKLCMGTSRAIAWLGCGGATTGAAGGTVYAAIPNLAKIAAISAAALVVLLSLGACYIACKQRGSLTPAQAAKFAAAYQERVDQLSKQTKALQETSARLAHVQQRLTSAGDAMAATATGVAKSAADLTRHAEALGEPTERLDVMTRRVKAALEETGIVIAREDTEEKTFRDAVATMGQLTGAFEGSRGELSEALTALIAFSGQDAELCRRLEEDSEALARQVGVGREVQDRYSALLENLKKAVTTAETMSTATDSTSSERARLLSTLDRLAPEIVATRTAFEATLRGILELKEALGREDTTKAHIESLLKQITAHLSREGVSVQLREEASGTEGDSPALPPPPPSPAIAAPPPPPRVPTGISLAARLAARRSGGGAAEVKGGR